MADEFANIVTNEDIGRVAETVREVIMIGDSMTIAEMPDKIRLAKTVEEVDGGLFTDWEPEEEEVFDAGELTEEDHLVFDTKRFRRRENGETNTD